MRFMLPVVALSGVFGLAGLPMEAPRADSQPPKPTSPQQPELPAGHPQIIPPAAPEGWPVAKPEDVGSIDGIIKAFYEASSGEKGQPRDWDRYRSLFQPDARLIVARAAGGQAARAVFLRVSEYIEANKVYFEKGGFVDKEVARRTESFSSIAQVWSTFESRRSKDSPAPYARGITSLQLLKDGDRWWIINVFWDHERADVPIPEKYLTSTAP